MPRADAHVPAVDRRRRPSLTVTLCLSAVILAGLIGIGLGLSRAWWAYHELGNWVPVEARVVDQRVVETRNAEETVTKHSYRPQVAFPLPGGGSMWTETLDWSDQPFQPGQMLPVRYKPDDPAKVVMASVNQVVATGVLGAVMGLLFVLVGAVTLRRARRSR